MVVKLSQKYHSFIVIGITILCFIGIIFYFNHNEKIESKKRMVDSIIAYGDIKLTPTEHIRLYKSRLSPEIIQSEMVNILKKRRQESIVKIERNTTENMISRKKHSIDGLAELLQQLATLKIQKELIKSYDSRIAIVGDKNYLITSNAQFPINSIKLTNKLNPILWNNLQYGMRVDEIIFKFPQARKIKEKFNSDGQEILLSIDGIVILGYNFIANLIFNNQILVGTSLVLEKGCSESEALAVFESISNNLSTKYGKDLKNSRHKNDFPKATIRVFKSVWISDETEISLNGVFIGPDPSLNIFYCSALIEDEKYVPL